MPWPSRRTLRRGGEGVTEGLRAYLERSFDAVYSGYGASDLAIGIAAGP
jgi:phenylacetate-CoA ligase